jgi:hypothetical protein
MADEGIAMSRADRPFFYLHEEHRPREIPLIAVADFEFLAWMRLVMFFRDDLFRQLVRLGMDEGQAFFVVRSEAVRKADVVQFYHDYGRTDPQFFERFLQECWDMYRKAGGPAV